jgi:hypothetical protein
VRVLHVDAREDLGVVWSSLGELLARKVFFF